MTKRLAAAFGLLLLGALVLTACGGGGEGTSSHARRLMGPHELGPGLLAIARGDKTNGEDMRNSTAFVLGALVVPAVICGMAAVFASSVTVPNVFTGGTPAIAAEVNANFAAVEAAINDNNARIESLEGGAVLGTEPLCIIRGSVNADGSIENGTGFSVVKGGTGEYTIVFDLAFIDFPTLSGTVLLGPGGDAGVFGNVSSSAADISFTITRISTGHGRGRGLRLRRRRSRLAPRTTGAAPDARISPSPGPLRRMPSSRTKAASQSANVPSEGRRTNSVKS